MTEKEEFCAFLSRKISFIPITHLSYGKEIKDVNGSRELVECNFRQYNFDLEDGIFYLWIKKESEYFKHQESFKIVVNNWQQIPITYETLLLMQDAEITKIYFDLD
jgi:hypothetical protein